LFELPAAAYSLLRDDPTMFLVLTGHEPVTPPVVGGSAAPERRLSLLRRPSGLR